MSAFHPNLPRPVSTHSGRKELTFDSLQIYSKGEQSAPALCPQQQRSAPVSEPARRAHSAPEGF
jgi:hypothetical protein